ncbi:MAG: hypothetical protein ABIH87_01525 [bacterium]
MSADKKTSISSGFGEAENQKSPRSRDCSKTVELNAVSLSNLLSRATEDVESEFTDEKTLEAEPGYEKQYSSSQDASNIVKQRIVELVLNGPEPADLLNFPEHILRGIREVLVEELISRSHYNLEDNMNEMAKTKIRSFLEKIKKRLGYHE